MPMDDGLRAYCWYKLAGAVVRMEEGDMPEVQRLDLAQWISGQPGVEPALAAAAEKLAGGDLLAADVQPHLRKHVSNLGEIQEVRESFGANQVNVNPEGAPLNERMAQLLGNQAKGFLGSDAAV